MDVFPVRYCCVHPTMAQEVSFADLHGSNQVRDGRKHREKPQPVLVWIVSHNGRGKCLKRLRSIQPEWEDVGRCCHAVNSIGSIMAIFCLEQDPSFFLITSGRMMLNQDWSGSLGRRRDDQCLATKALATVYQVPALSIGMRSSVVDSACNINLVIANCSGKTDSLSAAGDPACIHSTEFEHPARLRSQCLPPLQQGFKLMCCPSWLHHLHHSAWANTSWLLDGFFCRSLNHIATRRFSH